MSSDNLFPFQILETDAIAQSFSRDLHLGEQDTVIKTNRSFVPRSQDESDDNYRKRRLDEAYRRVEDKKNIQQEVV